MRPRRKILIAGGDEDSMSILTYTLSLQPWCEPRRAQTKAQFRSLLAAPGIGQAWAGVIILDCGDHHHTLELAKLAFPCCPVMIIATTDDFPTDIPPTISVPKATDNAAIIEHLKVLVARKREPRKGWKQAADIGEAA